jgi:hypothetical protein
VKDRASFDVDVDKDRRAIPEVRYGWPNEEADPLVERHEFLESIIVKPLPVSEAM